MLTVLTCGIFFVFSVFVHLFACRRSNDKSLKAKLFIMIAALHLAVFVVTAVFMNMPLIFAVSAIYVLLVPVYLVFYVSTELVSPSKIILWIAGSSGGAGYAGIFKALEKENMIMTRLEELEHSGCAVCVKGRYTLTGAGRGIARFLNYYQKILGRDVGG